MLSKIVESNKLNLGANRPPLANRGTIVLKKTEYAWSTILWQNKKRNNQEEAKENQRVLLKIINVCGQKQSCKIITGRKEEALIMAEVCNT